MWLPIHSIISNYLNDLLNELELSSFGACIYGIVLGHPAFADELAILSFSPTISTVFVRYNSKISKS